MTKPTLPAPARQATCDQEIGRCQQRPQPWLFLVPSAGQASSPSVMSTYSRSNRRKAINHLNQSSFLFHVSCWRKVDVPSQASHNPGIPLTMNKLATSLWLVRLDGTPVSGPLISTGLRQCPDSSLGREGRFKHGGQGTDSLLSPSIGMIPAHTSVPRARIRPHFTLARQNYFPGTPTP